jgi:uncharacterized membrane protein
MFGIPLHPLVVHFPVVLAVLLPIAIVVALFAIRKGAGSRRVWSVPTAIAAALALSAWVSTETGESQEDRVERVVAESALNTHEEAAERFLVLSGVLALVAVAGLARGTVGRAARIVTAVGAVGVLGAGVQVGHSGGVLVYREGAASAYANAPTGDRGIGRSSTDAMAKPDDHDDRDRR